MSDRVSDMTGQLHAAPKLRVARTRPAFGQSGNACVASRRQARYKVENREQGAVMAGDERMGESSEAAGEPPGGSALPAGTRAVFLSYASHDVAIANTVCQFLESHGVSCWLAPRDVKPGAQYADAIVRAINEAKALVLVLSASALASAHVGREVERAAAKRKQIIAFRVDAAALSPEFEYFLSNSQWIDAPALGMPAALARLKEAMGERSAGSLPENPWLRAELKPVGKPRVGVARRVVVAAAVVVVGSVLTLGVRLWSSNHRAPQSAVSTSISDKSIAVLPFADMSEKKDQEYFADGMAEEIIDNLTRIPAIKVIGRTSSFQFKGKNADLRTIGMQLGAAYVVEGSVRRSDNHVRVTAQLIRTSDGAHQWSSTYDRSVDDLLQVQAEIAMAVGRALKLSVSNLQAERAPVVPEAYDLYLRGLHAGDQYSRDGLAEADNYLQRAIELDPHFAPAYAQLAGTHLTQTLYGFVPPETGFARAKDDAMRLLKLDPKSGWAHAFLCRIHTAYTWDWSEAERECATALALAPQNWAALYEAADLALALGDYEKSERLFRSILTIDPLNPDALLEMSQPLLRLGRLAEAETEARRGLAISPTYVGGHYWLGTILLAEGRLEDARREFEQEAPEGGRQAGLAIVYHALGREIDAESALKGFIADQADGSAYGVAEVYGYFGDADHAFESLERAYRQKDTGLQYLKGDWLLKSLEGDARYKAFLKKMNLPGGDR